jgi:tetratricopeptide (TPR) repeat protein
LSFINKYKWTLIPAVLLFALFSFKTLTRMPVWESDNALTRSVMHDAPNSAKAHLAFALTLRNSIADQASGPVMRTKIYKKAIEEFNRTLEIYPCYAEAYRWMGGTYYVLGDTVNTIKCYEEGLKCDPINAGIINDQGFMLFDQEKYEEAMLFFRKALHNFPQYPDALKNMGACYTMLNNFDSALYYFNRAAEYELLDDSRIYIYDVMGQIYMAKKDPSTAQIYYGKVKAIEDYYYK